MRKGSRCVAQTINLSNPKTCVRPSQVQKLLSADVMEPCPDLGRGQSAYWTPRPVTVKVCTRRDVERTCPPKLCDCPQKGPALTSGQRLCRALMFFMKGAIVAGLIYWTYSEGLWGDSNDTEDLYRRMMSTMSPSVPDDDISLPSLESMKYSMLEAYNHAVFKVMDILVGVPLRLQRKVQDALFGCDDGANVEEKSGDRLVDSQEKK